jgi:hypothetical protein
MKADKAIEDLIALNLPLNVKTNYKLSQISLAVRSQASIIQMTKDQILKKYFTDGVLDDKSPNFILFFNEWKEVADIETNIDVDKIKIDELDVKSDIIIPINILRDLNSFIEK